MRQIPKLFIASAIFILISLSTSFSIYSSITQDDTVKIQHVYNVPIIDGLPDDACWDSARWQIMDQVWIPYGTNIDSSDFYGRYKVVWSSTTNLLYFLAETTDDIFVDGYIYKSSPSGNNYPDFDVLEVFIDENRSKGLHVFDNTCTDVTNPNCWGINAQNAFSYHIVAMAPNDGEVQFDKDVCDISGSGWSDEVIRNYKSHLPEFALKKNGNQYTWEFSMKVYRDTYNPKNPSDTSLAFLTGGKKMGLDLAYCDDDTPQDIKRKSFIGSSRVPPTKFNDHWKDAGDFGLAILQPAQVVNSVQKAFSKQFNCYYTASTKSIEILIPETNSKIGNIGIYNILGSQVYQNAFNVNNGTMTLTIPNLQLRTGVYLVNCSIGNMRLCKKIVIN